MASSEVSKAVFVDTNLGTHLAVPASPETTAMEFKRELEKMHMKCFPELGNVKVNGLMVKRKSHYYHLSDSLPIKYAFQGLNCPWFLRIELHTQIIAPENISFQCHGTQVSRLDSAGDCVDSVKLKSSLLHTNKNKIKCERKNSKGRRLLHTKFPALRIYTVFCLFKRKKKRKITKRDNKVGCQERALAQWPLLAKKRQSDSMADVENLGETLSESVSVSVSGIIKKYFSDYDEVVSSSHYPFAPVRTEDRTFLNVRPDLATPLKTHKCPQLFPEATRDKCKKPEVGKRLLLASNSLGLTPDGQQAVLSLCKSSGEKSPVYKSSTRVRSLVFEIAEEDD